MCQQEIKWLFNPPTASHMGGVWERIVQSVKKIFKALVSEQIVDDESGLTLMAETESIELSSADSKSWWPSGCRALDPKPFVVAETKPTNATRKLF